MAPGMIARVTLLILGLAAGASAPPRTIALQARTMGTVATVQIVASDSAAAQGKARAAFTALATVDSLMSNWTTTSEVARLNQRAGERLAVEPEVATVLAAALRIGDESGGAFDVTVEPLVRLWGFLGGSPRVPARAEIEATLGNVGPHHLDFDAATRSLRADGPNVRIDLGGIAKGHGVDRAAAALLAAGVTDALVDVSGNMMPLGSPPGREAWIVGVRDPFDRAPYFARLRLLAGEGIATSGDYEQFIAVDGHRYGHILDPRTGWPTHDLVAVTTLAPTALEADAWSTAFFVLGADASRALARQRGDLSVILVQAATDGVHDVWVEESLRSRFVLEPGMESTFTVHWF